MSRRDCWIEAGVDAAAVAATWAALVWAECVAVSLLWPDAFSASWEYMLARRLVAPIAIAMLAPGSVVAVGLWRLAAQAAQGAPGAKRVLLVAGAVAAGGVAFGVSAGRHFAHWALRAPFLVALAALGAVGGGILLPRLPRLARHPLALATVGTTIAAGGWLADALVLPRLYPAFHAAMFAVCLFGGA